MLDFVFYSLDHHCSPATVSLSDSLYQWLAGSDFATWAKPQPVQLVIEGELTELDLIPLMDTARDWSINFFQQTILQETEAFLNQATTDSATQDPTIIDRLKQLYQILNHLKDSSYSYLQC